MTTREASNVAAKSRSPNDPDTPLRRTLKRLVRMEPIGTVIDVGVHRGTPELYSAFAACDFLLVDPKRDLDKATKPERYKLLNVALGAEPGTAELHVMGPKTTLLERTALTASPIKESYSVEITTLDSVIGEHVERLPIGLKIDTEGYEIEVMRGLDARRADVRFIIAEASVRKRFVGGYMFSDLIAAMKSRGFEFATFLNEHKVQPLLYDVLFLPPDHPFYG